MLLLYITSIISLLFSKKPGFGDLQDNDNPLSRPRHLKEKTCVNCGTGRGVILKFKVTGIRGVMRKLFEVSSRFGDFLQGIVLGREIITVTLCKMILSITFISKLRYKTTINTDKKTWDFSRYCGFQKHANSEIQNTIKGLRFSLPSII